MSFNPESTTNKQGEIHPSIAPGRPMAGGEWHKPGTKVNPQDHADTFQAKTVPKGTAPEENLFYPNPQGTVPGSNEDMLRSHGKESTQTTASSTLGGATSADVNKGMGKPAVGQSSAEMRHEGHSHRKKEHAGIEGSGAGTSKSGMKRAEKIGEPARKTEGSANAEDRVPESAERM